MIATLIVKPSAMADFYFQVVEDVTFFFFFFKAVTRDISVMMTHSEMQGEDGCGWTVLLFQLSGLISAYSMWLNFHQSKELLWNHLPVFAAEADDTSNCGCY